MDTISQKLSMAGIDEGHTDYETLYELLSVVLDLKKTIEPFISNDPVKHRFNLKIRGRIYPFIATQDEEYFLRKAAKLLNNK